jgi:hypothetical protein
LREIIEQQLARTKELEKSTGRIIRWLFHRNGRPIKTFRRSWVTACVKAGLRMRITCKECDSAEKVFFRKSKKNISHTDALYRTIGAWLIIFFIPNFRE